jgi:hypothetical protein
MNSLRLDIDLTNYYSSGTLKIERLESQIFKALGAIKRYLANNSNITIL